ncbi:helix-turn-helix transcriptional regulator [Pedobacter sp. P351]|uniref:helix-turn-helix transcriptional regulator n=1 Tax=Pedobacter superstes TaxID=3133441 RepID=UPI0030B1FB00
MLSNYLKQKRKAFGFTQEDLAVKAGVGLRFIREIEQGKTTLRMDKVNQVLALFGAQLGVISKQKDHE